MLLRSLKEHILQADSLLEAGGTEIDKEKHYNDMKFSGSTIRVLLIAVASNSGESFCSTRSTKAAFQIPVTKASQRCRESTITQSAQDAAAEWSALPSMITSPPQKKSSSAQAIHSKQMETPSELKNLDKDSAAALYSDIFNQPLGSLRSLAWNQQVLRAMDYYSKDFEVCQALLNRVLKDYNANKQTKATPTQQDLLREMYTRVLESLGQSLVIGADQAQKLWDQMRNDSNASDADIGAYNAYLVALQQSQMSLLKDTAQSKDTCDKVQAMAQLALEALNEMLYNVPPDKISFQAVLSLLSKSGYSQAGHNTLQVLEWMEESNSCAPDTNTYNNAINTLIKSSHKDSHTIVGRLIQKMNGTLNCKPNLSTYNLWINALARNAPNNSNLAEQAERIVMEMEASNEAYNGISPDKVSYSAAIDAWARCRQPQRAEALLEHMAKRAQEDSSLFPNAVVVNSVLSAYARVGARDRVKAIIARMEQMAETREELKPCAFTYTTYMDTLAKSMDESAESEAHELLEKMISEYNSGNESVKPTVQTYNALLNVHAKSPAKGSARRALDLLATMEASQDIHPNVISYSTVMNALARSREPIQQVEQLMQKVESLYQQGDLACRPTSFTYGALIEAYCKCATPDTLKKAEQLLKRMIQDYKRGANPDALPNKIMYTNVIDAYSKLGEAQNAEILVLEMERLWREGSKTKPNKMDQLRPNAVTYSAAINAWAKSRTFGKANKAYQMLQRMIQLYKDTGRTVEDLRPSVFAFTAVMNACAYVVGRDQSEKAEALKIATATYKQSKASPDRKGQPNHVTYGTFIKACTNLIPEGPERDASLASVFEKCCQDGQVSDLVLKNLRDGCSRDFFQKLVGQIEAGRLDTNELPSEWTKNVSTQR